MQAHELTLSQAVQAQLQIVAKHSADEVERIAQRARNLEQGSLHLTQLDHSELVILADLLDAQRAKFPQLADWTDAFSEEYSRRIHTRSNC